MMGESDSAFHMEKLAIKWVGIYFSIYLGEDESDFHNTLFLDFQKT